MADGKQEAIRRAVRAGLGLLHSASFPVSFCRSLWYTCFAVHPRYLTGEGVKGLNHLLTILESVVANVISHYICKWLGKLDKNRKPD